jgi:hypothetical protein
MKSKVAHESLAPRHTRRSPSSPVSSKLAHTVGRLALFCLGSAKLSTKQLGGKVIVESPTQKWNH